jgi:quinol monooxygenase YgiN
MTDFARRVLFQSAAAGAALAMLADSAEAGAKSYLVVVAELTSKPDTADQLRELIVPFAKQSAHEPGCIHYSLLEDENKPGHFLTYETWVSRAALDAHMKTPAMAAAGPKLGLLLAAPFTQTFLTKLTG